MGQGSGRILGAFALATVLALARPVLAAEEAQAQALFVEGRAAMEKGDFVAACASFEKSLALVQRAGTLVNLAQCEEKQGKLVAAAKHWNDGIALLPPTDERLAASKDRASSLVQRIPRLTVKLSAPAPTGARAELDGAVVSFDNLAAGVPLDPGKHVVVLTAPGAAEQRSSVELVEGQPKTLTMTLSPAVVVTSVTPPPSNGPSGMRTAGFVLLGVGGVGVIMAAATGAVLVSKNSSIQSDCPVAGGVHQCTAAGRDLINSTGSLKVVNGVGWGLAIAGVGVGTALVIVGGRSTSAPATGGVRPSFSTAIVPVAGGAGVAHALEF